MVTSGQLSRGRPRRSLPDPYGDDGPNRELVRGTTSCGTPPTPAAVASTSRTTCRARGAATPSTRSSPARTPATASPGSCPGRSRRWLSEGHPHLGDLAQHRVVGRATGDGSREPPHRQPPVV